MVSSRKAWRHARQMYRKAWFIRIVTPWGLGVLPYLTLRCYCVPHPGHFHTWSSSEFGQNKAPEETVLDLKYFWVPYPSSVGMWFILHLFRTAPGSCSALLWKLRKRERKKGRGREKERNREKQFCLALHTDFHSPSRPILQWLWMLRNCSTKILNFFSYYAAQTLQGEKKIEDVKGGWVAGIVSNVRSPHLQHGTKRSVIL